MRRRYFPALALILTGCGEKGARTGSAFLLAGAYQTEDAALPVTEGRLHGSCAGDDLFYGN